MRRRLPWLTILQLEALQQHAQHFICTASTTREDQVLTIDDCPCLWQETCCCSVQRIPTLLSLVAENLQIFGIPELMSYIGNCYVPKQHTLV